jgi:ATP-dependent RNA helicase DeaD
MTDNTDFGDAPLEGSQTENFEGKAFSMADLPQNLQAAASRLKWAELMPVQVQTIPHMLGGQDVMVQSQTGSGKTGAFLLPILDRIDTGIGAPQALVLVPTRELAVQVTRDAEELGREAGVKPLSIYGGVGYKPQIQGLEDGAQLIIGTPGRILDHLLKGNLNLDRLKILVFDEADRMLSMGFYPDMKQLQRYLPRGLQSTMFSATYPGHVKRLAQQFLKDPLFVSLSQSQVHVSDVLHVVYKVPAMQKSRILVKIIEMENPASAIIFCNTKADVHFVGTVLRRFGYDVGEISADLTQGAREEVLEKLRLNKLKFLVATDVAARGIDIHELSHVFQYQPPQDHEAYVHRTGRTGRAGRRAWPSPWSRAWKRSNSNRSPRSFPFPWSNSPCPPTRSLRPSFPSGPCSCSKPDCARRTTSRRSACSASCAPWANWRPTTNPARFWPCWWTNSTRVRSMPPWSSRRRSWLTWCVRRKLSPVPFSRPRPDLSCRSKACRQSSPKPLRPSSPRTKRSWLPKAFAPKARSVGASVPAKSRPAAEKSQRVNRLRLICP